MSTSSSTTIIQDFEKVVPEDYLKKVLTQHSKSVGIALSRENGTLELIRHHNVAVQPSMLQAFLSKDELKQKCVLINLQGEVKYEDDVGPYPLILNADNQPLLVCALDGDFSVHAQETSHAPETFVVAKIKEKVSKLYARLSNNMEELMKELGEDEFFGQGIINMIADDRGTITLMAFDGAFLHFSAKDDKTVGDTDFGWASNNFETPAAAPEVKTEKKESLADAFGTSLGVSKSGEAGTVVPPTPAPAVKTEPKQVHNRPTIASTAPISRVSSGDGKIVEASGAASKDGPSGTTEFMELPVPASVMGDAKKMKAWLTNRIPGGGPLPKDWFNMKVLKVAKGSKNIPKKFMADWGTLISSQHGLKAVSEALSSSTAPTKTSVPEVKLPATQVTSRKRPTLNAAPPAPVEQPKEVPGTGPQPEVVQPKPEVKQEKGFPERKEETVLAKDTGTRTVSNKNAGIVAGPLPMLPPQQHQKLIAMIESAEFKTSLDRHSQEIADPTKYAEYEKKFPNLAHLLGKKSFDEINWGYPEMHKIATEIGVEAICILAFNRHFELKQYERFANELLAENEALKQKLEGSQTQTQKIAANGSGVRHRRPTLAG